MFDAAERERLSKQLRRGLETLKLPLDSAACDKYIDHIALLNKWNQAYNLTSVRTPREMITRHVLDSLSVVWFVHGPKVLDMGTGAGFPGIPIAIACQDLEVALVDSSAKKIDFVRHVIANLGLQNVKVVHRRVNGNELKNKFETILCRAFGPLGLVAELGAPLLQPEGAILAMKGKFPESEIGELPSSFNCQVHKLAVPELEESRHLIVIKQLSVTIKQN